MLMSSSARRTRAAVGQRTRTAEAAHVLPALPTAGKPRHMLLGCLPCMRAGSWRDAGAAGGRGPRLVLMSSGAKHTRAANGRRTGTAGSWRDASTADGLSAVRTSSSLMHTLAAVDQRACTAGGWRCAGAADGRKAEARAHKLERDAHAMRTHAVGRCACARQAAGLMPALPTAGRPHLVLTGSSARHARAAIGLRAYTAGSWCDASAAGGRKAAARAHELGGDAHARYHGQRALMAGSWRDARAADGWKAASLTHELECDGHARCRRAPCMHGGQLARCQRYRRLEGRVLRS